MVEIKIELKVIIVNCFLTFLYDAFKRRNKLSNCDDRSRVRGSVSGQMTEIKAGVCLETEMKLLVVLI